ncbi:hypothetical protein NLI96_g6288 [Meripilus lineatus]|uniref:Uncharacterized protein n=1 Tax=Meripilus lineatus TaxID=2056292 RepID=A0AAD5V2Y6_9APHY|nr:hypothetical protein NLI96_g6288 [Physisporinus lineatus]
MASHQPPIDISTTRTAASSSRLQPSASQLPPPPVADSHPKTFKRLRTSLEQSIRTATKSKSRPGTANTAVEEDGTISQSKMKGKEKASQELAQPAPQPKDKPRSRMLSKVSFRRTGRDSLSPSPAPPPVPTVLNEAKRVERDRDKDPTHQRDILAS